MSSKLHALSLSLINGVAIKRKKLQPQGWQCAQKGTLSRLT